MYCTIHILQQIKIQTFLNYEVTLGHSLGVNDLFSTLSGSQFNQFSIKNIKFSYSPFSNRPGTEANLASESDTTVVNASI